MPLTGLANGILTKAPGGGLRGVPSLIEELDGFMLYQNMFLPKGWDDAWRLARATGTADIVAIGDSITAGQGATDIMSTSWWAQLRARILSGKTLRGDHYTSIYAAKRNANTPTATPPLVILPAGANSVQYFAGFMSTEFNAGVATPYMTCTPPYNVTGFEIVYMDYATGSWTWNVDGGANTTVNTTGPGAPTGAIVKKTTVTGLASGSHTLNINAGATGNTCNILGVTAITGSTGIRFANMGLPGMGLYTGQSANNALADTGTFPPDRLSLYQGYQGTTASPSQLTGLGFPAQPDLALIALGCNDSNQSVTKANFKAALERLVYALKYGKSGAVSIAIIAMYQADGNLAASSVVTNQDYTGGAVAGYRDLKAAMLEVAQMNDCAYIDVHNLFGRLPLTNGWITANNNVHPTDAGHAKIGNFLAQVIN